MTAQSDKRFAVALMGKDRPGIVAGVTGALLELHCNLEDLCTSILRGHFAMVLVLTGPAGAERGAVQARLEPVAEHLGLDYAVWEAEGSTGSAVATHVITAYGHDRKGIVHAIAEVLARREVNICDAVSRLGGGPDATYVLTLEVGISEVVNERGLAREIEQVAAAFGFTTNLLPIERADL
jgi:glycine cleavage system transcriptional repressor